MTAGETVITATLDNSETTREFLATLPRTLTMSPYGEREYYGRIEELSDNGEAVSDFENGDVTYCPAVPPSLSFMQKKKAPVRAGSFVWAGLHPTCWFLRCLEIPWKCGSKLHSNK